MLMNNRLLINIKEEKTFPPTVEGVPSTRFIKLNECQRAFVYEQKGLDDECISIIKMPKDNTDIIPPINKKNIIKALQLSVKPRKTIRYFSIFLNIFRIRNALRSLKRRNRRNVLKILRYRKIGRMAIKSMMLLICVIHLILCLIAIRNDPSGFFIMSHKKSELI